MKRLGEFLMWAGVAVGLADAGAMAAHIGIAGVPWLVNVALAKFAIVGALGLMTSGAVLRRLALRRELRELQPPRD